MHKWDDPGWLRQKYVEERKSMSEVADEAGTSLSTVRRRLIEHELGPRSRAEAQLNRTPGVHYRTNNRGREVWSHQFGDEQHLVQVARLAAVAWEGYDAVAGKHVHHDPNIPWLNTEDAIHPRPERDHMRLHGADGRDPVWRDPDWLRRKYYDEGLTWPEIADVADCSLACVQKWMNRHDIQPRRRGRYYDQRQIQ